MGRTKMKGPYQAIPVTDKVYWVGALDWTLREFHGYATPRGSTYNAYLVMADEIALMDTVKAGFEDQLLSRVGSVVDPQSIRYVISHHSEMDHSGALPQVVEAVKPEKVIASSKGVPTLQAHFHADWNMQPVKDGESLSLGNMTLRFLESPMLHWPESMCSYLVEQEVLFSQDAFGVHLCSQDRFADQIEEALLRREEATYFANIILPYAPLVTKFLEKVRAAGVAPKIIAPDHGPVWRKDLQTVVRWYAEWAEQRPTKRAVVVYDTMWQSTAKMARAIVEGLAAGGAAPVLVCLGASPRSEAVTEVLEAGALLVGSPTMNNEIFPTVADFLTYLKGLKPRNLIGAAFGSYGWGGQAVRHLMQALTDMGVETIGEGLQTKFVPDEKALEECHSLGLLVAEKLMQRVGAP